MLLKRFFLIFTLLLLFFSAYAYDKATPREGEGVHAFLRRNHRPGDEYYIEFLKINKQRLGRNNTLLKGVTYFLPPLSPGNNPDKNSETVRDANTEARPSVNGKTLKQPLFGKKYEEYTIKDHILAGACFFLVSGHGGPDSGAIAKVDGHELHEDEYAYDIILRLARSLLEHDATVHIIIQDPKDGIRDGMYLNNSKKETCMGKEIPLNQNKRLKQRSEKINSLSSRSKAKYQRAIFIHLDSRSQKEQLDVFFYYQNKSSNKKRSVKLAETMQETFKTQYKKHQPNRGFSGTVTTRSLAVLRNTEPVSIFVELANMQNKSDQRRYILDDNRQALANWLCMGFIRDYQAAK